MAQMQLMCDSDSHMVECSINGKPVDNVAYARVMNHGSPSKPKYHFQIERHETDGDVHTMTTHMSAASAEAKAALRDGTGRVSELDPSLVAIPSRTEVQDVIAAMFGK